MDKIKKLRLKLSEMMWKWLGDVLGSWMIWLKLFVLKNFEPSFIAFGWVNTETSCYIFVGAGVAL